MYHTGTWTQEKNSSAITEKGSRSCLFGGYCSIRMGLKSSNVFRLRTFLALGNSELNLLAFCQSFETAALNSAVVNKNVRAAFTSDKAKAFCFVEELNSTGSSRHT